MALENCINNAEVYWEHYLVEDKYEFDSRFLMATSHMVVNDGRILATSHIYCHFIPSYY